MRLSLLERTRRQAGVLVLLLLLAGCMSTPQTKKLLADPPRELLPLYELSQTPFFPQQRYQCGPAALATVLNYHAAKVTPVELVAQVYVPERQGSLQIEMVAAARQYGMLVYPLRPNMADLLFEVAAGHPVLVMQNLSFDWLPVWHYAVVIGYDLSNSQVILRSGETRRWITSMAAFERTWARADHWARVILPPAQIPKTAQPLHFLKAALELEQTQQAQAAYQAYQAAARHWPEQPRIWLALGNATYQRQRFRESAAAFLNVTRIEPGNVTGWNNLAYALSALGCPQQARRAITCAYDLAPQDRNVQNSREEIGLAEGEWDRPACPQIRCLQP